MRTSHRSIKLILLLAEIGFIFYFTLPLKPPINWQSATVEYILDGDSLVVRQGNDELELRLIGIDAPERGAPWAEEARQFLVSQLPPGQTVYFTEENPLRDAYDRHLVVLYTKVSASFDHSLNARLVALGLAFVPDYPDPTMYYQELKVIEEQAKMKKLGIHSDS